MFYLKVQSQSINTPPPPPPKKNIKIKQQVIHFDQLYIHSEVSSTLQQHIATSILVHVQLNNTYSTIYIKHTNKAFHSWG